LIVTEEQGKQGVVVQTQDNQSTNPSSFRLYVGCSGATHHGEAHFITQNLRLRDGLLIIQMYLTMWKSILRSIEFPMHLWARIGIKRRQLILNSWQNLPR
jgi:hypothetical protein